MCARTVNEWVYGWDGKWLKRGIVVLIHRDVTHRETLWWGVGKSESIAVVTEGLVPINRLTKKNPPSGGISDWKKGVVGVIGETWPGIPQQRCLVHVERDLKRLLPLRSPIPATQALRKIALTILHLPTVADRNRFLFQLLLWHSEYEYLLKERTVPELNTTKKKWWYTHGNLRRAWRLLTHDTDSLFRYLDYPLLPTTNNSLEGVNSQLPRRRGLPKPSQVSLMFWQLALSRCQTPTQLRRLWADWNRVAVAGKPTIYVT